MNGKGYIQLFLSFFKIGLFTIGGGYAMLPLIQHEVVEKRHWLDDDTFMDGLAASQACPGPVAVNLSVYAGYHIAGWAGLFLAVLGTILPSFLIILLIAFSFSSWSSLPLVRNAFHGLRPAVTALIAVPVIQLAQKAKIRWHAYWLPLAAVALIIFLKVSPIWLILFTILLAAGKYQVQRVNAQTKEK